MQKKEVITVKGVAITMFQVNGEHFISLTDIARTKNPLEPKDVVKNWMRSKATIEFLGLWEQLNNPTFKGVEFDPFMVEAGSNSFTLSPHRWVEKTGAVGMLTRKGNNGGTFAHKDIAFEFASWVSSSFKLYLIKEFQRLKAIENPKEWNLRRTLARINYRIHTDAVKENIIPPLLSREEAAGIYAEEAELLNIALFGKTSVQWRAANPKAEGNIRDHSSMDQLLVLANLESLNAALIQMGMPMAERLQRLNETAIRQMKSLLNAAARQQLK